MKPTETLGPAIRTVALLATKKFAASYAACSPSHRANVEVLHSWMGVFSCSQFGQALIDENLRSDDVSDVGVDRLNRTLLVLLRLCYGDADVFRETGAGAWQRKRVSSGYNAKHCFNFFLLKDWGTSVSTGPTRRLSWRTRFASTI